MTVLLQVILSFLFVTLIGGVFASRLQHRNWIRQQQIASKEKLISDLKSIFVELDGVMSRRLYRTRRLLYILRRYDQEKFENELKRYNETLDEWNEKRNSFQIRLVRVVSTELAQDFEHDLSKRFVSIGGRLERRAREITAGKKPHAGDVLREVEIELDGLSRSIYEFMRSIYISLQKEEKELYTIDKSQRVPKDESDLDSVSTWFLIKSLFIPTTQLRKQA